MITTTIIITTTTNLLASNPITNPHHHHTYNTNVGSKEGGHFILFLDESHASTNAWSIVELNKCLMNEYLIFFLNN